MTGPAEGGRTARGTVLAPASANLLALAFAGLALYQATGRGTLEQAALAGGLVLVAALAAGLGVVWRWQLDSGRLAALPALALVATTAAIHGAAALPVDLHLRTVGRPPQFLGPLIVAIGLVVIAQMVMVGRGARPARAGLLMLIPLVALEGLPLDAPPAFAAGAGAVLLLLSAPRAGSVRVPLLAPLIALLVCFSVSTALGADPTPGVDLLIRLAALACAFLLIAADDEPERAARVALVTLLGTLAAVAGAALLARWLLSGTLSALGADVMLTEMSLFGRHPNVLAPWFAAGAILALHLALGRTGGIRALAVCVLPPAAACLLMTASRLAIGAALAGVFLPALLRVWRVKSLLLAGLGAAIVLGAALAFVPALRDKTLNRAGHAYIPAESHRVHRMRVAFDTALERPLLGQGPLCWFRQGAFARRSRFEGEDTADHPHCLPLALFEGTGVVGTAAFLLLLIAAGILVRNVVRDGDPFRRQTAIAVASALFVQLLTNLADAGDALETLVPSRLLIDLGILVALFRAGRSGPGRGVRVGPLARLAAGAIVGAVASVQLLAAGQMAAAATLARHGQSLRATELLETAARLLPYHVPVRSRLIGLGLATNDTSLSRKYLDEAVELAPDRPELHETRALFLMAIGNPRAAMNAARTAFELDPTGATGLGLAPLLAELMLANGDRAGGIEALAAAVRHDYMVLQPLIVDDRPNTLRLGQVEVRLEELLAALDDSSDAESSARARRRVPLRECDIHMLFGNLDAALAATRRIVEIAGRESVSSYQFAARVHLRAGEYQAALLAIDGALALSDSPYLYVDRGDILREMGRTEEAIETYSRGLAVSFDAHFGEVAYHQLIGRMEQAYAAAGRSEERSATLQKLCFFEPSDRERARLLVELAAEQRAVGLGDEERASLLRALRLVLATAVSDESRHIADAVGRRLAVAGGGLPSAMADELERLGGRCGGGPLLDTFRVALLEELGLPARAAAARQDLRGPAKR